MALIAGTLDSWGGPPAVDLRAWVEDIRVTRPSKTASRDLVRAPDGAASLLFRAFGDGTGDLSAVGPTSHAHYKTSGLASCYIHVRLRPGRARCVLGFPLNELMDGIAPLDTIWSANGKALLDQLLAAEPCRAVSLLEEALRGAIAGQGCRPSQVVSQAVNVIDGGSHASVGELARSLGLSARHLRDLFRTELGMSPKRYARIARLRRLLALDWLDAPWATLAAEAGYYDQAHMIADFRDLLLCTPQTYRSKVTDASGSPATRQGQPR